MAIELDFCEYPDNPTAQAAYVTDGGSTYGSDILTGGTASADSFFGGAYVASKACDNNEATEWFTNTAFPHWWKYDLGAGVTKTVTKLRIKPDIDAGILVKDFELLGSNNDSDWTSLTTGQHGNNQNWEDFTFTNTTAYRYYKLTFANNWGANTSSGSWEFEMIEGAPESLQSYSEATIKTQGSYSLKAVATTGALNKTLTRTVSPTIDLTGQTQIKYDQRALRTGSNIKISLHNATGAGYTIEHTHNQSADEFETAIIDISAVSDANKNAIDEIKIEVINADADNVVYIDNMYAETSIILIIGNCLHSHISENLSLLQRFILSIGNCIHNHISEILTLIQKNLLSINNSIHNHISENILLIHKYILSINKCLHIHVSKNMDLIQKFILSVIGSFHSHTSESLTFIQKCILEINNSFHSHTSDTIDLIQKFILAVANSIHTHISEIVEILKTKILAINNSVHSHIVKSSDLILKNVLAIENSIHKCISEATILSIYKVLKETHLYKVIKGALITFADTYIVPLGIKTKILTSQTNAITNKFEFRKLSIFSIGNKFRTKKLLLPVIFNRFRTRLSWQVPGDAGIEALGKTYFSVFINGIDITATLNVNMDSLRWKEVLNNSAEVDFILALPYDSGSKPTLEQSVEIKFNNKRKFYGYIASISKVSNPEGISIHAEGEYYKINQETVNFYVGRKEDKNIPETYYNTYAEALASLEVNFGIGDFVPVTENHNETQKADAISSIISQCGIFAWFIKPDGTKKLWEGGKGSLVTLEEQKIGKNINIYQVLNHDLREDDSSKIDKIKVIMGDDIKAGYDNTYMDAYVWNRFFVKSPDDNKLYDKGYISEINWKDTRGDLSNKSSTVAIVDGWKIIVPPGYFPGFPLKYDGKIYPAYKYEYADENIEEVSSDYGSKKYGGLYPEGSRPYVFYVGSGDKTMVLTLSNLNRQYGANYGIITKTMPHYSETVEYKWSNFWGWTKPFKYWIPEPSRLYYWGIHKYYKIPSWDDTDYAKDIANLEYYKYKDTKKIGTITITMDCADYYGIDLSKRITIPGLLDKANIKSIDYDVASYTVTISVESENYYKRSVSYLLHGKAEVSGTL